MPVPKGYVFAEYGCECGESNPHEFYQTRKTQCKNCFNDSQKKKWKDNKAKAVELKGGKCSCCGYETYIGALEFHHTDPNVKEDNWNKKWTLAWRKIEEAIKDTILLCANCHREEHARLRNEE